MCKTYKGLIEVKEGNGIETMWGGNRSTDASLLWSVTVRMRPFEKNKFRTST